MSLRWWKGGAFAGLLAAGFVGCGDSESSDGCDGGGCGGSGYVEDCGGPCWVPSTEDETFAEQFCSLTADCCVKVHGPRPPVPVPADHHQQCAATLLRAGFSRDAKVRADCLAELSANASADACLPEFLPPAPGSACSRLLLEPGGRVGLGGECQAASDCASAPGSITSCAILSGGPARCRRLTPGKPGDACIATVGLGLIMPVYSEALEGRYCSRADGYICQPLEATPDGHHCVPLTAEGQPCLWPFECASTSCTEEAGYVCTTPPAPNDLPLGASCANKDQCKSKQCLLDRCVSEGQHQSFLSFCALSPP